MITAFKADEFVLTEGEIDEYNANIADAEKRIAGGFFTTQEDLEKEAANW